MTDEISPERRATLLRLSEYYDPRGPNTEPRPGDPPAMSNGLEIGLPPEPSRSPNIVIEATNEHGGMEYAWEFSQRFTAHNRRTAEQVWARWQGGIGAPRWYWFDIVATAARNGWRLHLYEKGPVPVPLSSHGACGAWPYEDDGEPD